MVVPEDLEQTDGLSQVLAVDAVYRGPVPRLLRGLRARGSGTGTLGLGLGP